MEAVEAFALVAGHVDEELLLRNEYLAAENEILRSKLSGRPQLTNSERMRLAKLGKRLGLKALKDVAAIVKPETVLAWYRKLVARKFDGSAERGKSGRPRVDEEVEKLVLRMVEENPTWGYDRVAGALSNLGHDLSDETVGNILKRNGVPPLCRSTRSSQPEGISADRPAMGGWMGRPARDAGFSDRPRGGRCALSVAGGSRAGSVRSAKRSVFMQRVGIGGGDHRPGARRRFALGSVALSRAAGERCR